jgi:hypothetical protein
MKRMLRCLHWHLGRCLQPINNEAAACLELRPALYQRQFRFCSPFYSPTKPALSDEDTTIPVQIMVWKVRRSIYRLLGFTVLWRAYY